jgi:hypothetical protein
VTGNLRLRMSKFSKMHVLTDALWFSHFVIKVCYEASGEPTASIFNVTLLEVNAELNCYERVGYIGASEGIWANHSYETRG